MILKNENVVIYIYIYIFKKDIGNKITNTVNVPLSKAGCPQWEVALKKEHASQLSPAR